MDISGWDPIDGNNNATPPDGFPEGQSAKSLNDSSRAVMGGVRRQWEDKEWFNFGDDATFATATTFSVPGNLTARYHVNRRVRCVGTNTGTVYGKITNSVFGADTVVTVVFDASGVLVPEVDDSEAVSLGAAADNSSISSEAVSGLTEALAALLPPGLMMDYGGSTPPSGWVLCDGSAYDGNDPTYAALWGVLGNTYGGTGISNFEVPDRRGRVSVGSGSGAGLTPRSRGEIGGDEDHVLSLAEMPAHAHKNNMVDSGVTSEDAPNQKIYEPGTGGNDTESRGGNLPHNNMQPFLVSPVIIKL